jgi:putative ABC transport system substrate-binding protein
LSPGEPAGREKLLNAFHQGLAESGYLESKDFALEFHWVGTEYGRLDSVAADLVRRQVAVIVAPTLPSAVAAKRATTAIPIVFMGGDDPVRQGLVASLSRPGGNITGLSMLTAGLDAKRMQLLHDLAPRVTKMGLLVNPGNPNAQAQINDVQTAARAIARDIEVAQARNDDEIEAAFASLVKRQTGALLVGADPFFNNRRQQIVDLARRDRLPAIYEWREFVDAGGLASYGSSLADDYRKVGVYAGKVLAGAKPADLPVQQPTRFELVISLGAAKELCITVPPILLAQADEVIE